MKGHILVVEDEATVQLVLRSYLEAAGYTVTCVDDGVNGLQAALTQQPDLLILDINLPKMRGFEVAQQLRKHSDVYIIMLTAKGDEGDRIHGLEIGADDYVVKPFSPRELVARVTAALRRKQIDPPETVLRFAHLTIDLAAYELSNANGIIIDLTTTEFNVLLELVRHAGQVLSREQLLQRVWGHNYYGNDRVVDVYVGQVRRKLEEATGKLLITTVRGVGYKFADAPAQDTHVQ